MLIEDVRRASRNASVMTRPRVRKEIEPFVATLTALGETTGIVNY